MICMFVDFMVSLDFSVFFARRFPWIFLCLDPSVSLDLLFGACSSILVRCSYDHIGHILFRTLGFVQSFLL